MKKHIFIPNQRRYLPPKPRPAAPKQQVERVRVKQLDHVDMTWMARRINLAFNLAFILADIQQTLMMELEAHMHEKEKDETLSLDMRNSVERIKAHAANLVSFVDANTTHRFAEQFGEKADEIKEQLYKQFGIE